MIRTLSKWVCPPPETHDKPDPTQDRVEWFRCVPYILIHLGALLVFFTPFAWPCLAILLISYAARMFAITAFYHRYFSHRTFKTSRVVQFLGAFVACASGQRGPRFRPRPGPPVSQLWRSSSGRPHKNLLNVPCRCGVHSGPGLSSLFPAEEREAEAAAHFFRWRLGVCFGELHRVVAEW